MREKGNREARDSGRQRTARGVGGLGEERLLVEQRQQADRLGKVHVLPSGCALNQTCQQKTNIELEARKDGARTDQEGLVVDVGDVGAHHTLAGILLQLQLKHVLSMSVVVRNLREPD